MAAIVYLQLTDLDAFIEELKRRGIKEARLSEWIQRREVFERRKLRLTASDWANGLILRYDITFYDGFAVNLGNEHALKKLGKAREKVERLVTIKLEKTGINLLNGEYHTRMAGW